MKRCCRKRVTFVMCEVGAWKAREVLFLDVPGILHDLVQVEDEKPSASLEVAKLEQAVDARCEWSGTAQGAPFPSRRAKNIHDARRL